MIKSVTKILKSLFLLVNSFNKILLLLAHGKNSFKQITKYTIKLAYLKYKFKFNRIIILEMIKKIL